MPGFSQPGAPGVRLGIEVELHMEESHPPVRIVFGADGAFGSRAASG
jgi:hypothetical protein